MAIDFSEYYPLTIFRYLRHRGKILGPVRMHARVPVIFSIGWVTDFSRGSLQDITDHEVAKLVSDLERMVSQQAQKSIDWDQTRKEQGTWPTKMMVSTWFKNETNLVTMIDLLNKELEKQAAYKIHGQNVKARLEVSPQRKPSTMAKDLFFKGLKEMKGHESTSMGNFRYRSMLEEMLQLHVPVRAKVARKKASVSVLYRFQYHSGPKPIRTISVVLELICRFKFVVATIRIFGVFRVQSHTMWPYMCMCFGLFAPTHFHFEFCGVHDS